MRENYVISVLHIHSDPKFVSNSKIFNSKLFNNKIILLKIDRNNVIENEYTYFINYKLSDISKILDICRLYDIIVIYQLDFFKSYIINRLPNKCIIWRFFGHELYRELDNYVYSNLTKKTKNHLLQQIKDCGSSIKKFFEFGSTYNKEFSTALKRIDYFLGLSLNEYEFLKLYFPFLPPFIQHPFYTLETKAPECSKSKLIIIGNSRCEYNNHLDVIEIIEKLKNRSIYSFMMFFNYGPINNYTKIVKNRVEKIREIRLQEEFLSLNNYHEKYSKASALVINGHRQMAINNIFCAIRYGVKIYLNRKNIMYQWFEENGFTIFSIEDFEKDIQVGSIELPKNVAELNISMFEGLIRRYNEYDFQQQICSIVNRKII